jgi:hypothetical protein
VGCLPELPPKLPVAGSKLMRSAPIKTTAHDKIEDMMMTYRMIERRLMRWA